MASLQLENREALQLLLQAFGQAPPSPTTAGIKLSVRGNELSVDGPDWALKCVKQAYKLACEGRPLAKGDITRAFEMVKAGKNLDATYETILVRPLNNKPIVARSMAQRHYVDQIDNHAVTFGVGPAGVGKTWLAIAMAVRAFLQKKATRIILTRPVVEAGEKLGFLPGDLSAKLDPYMRPLYDALYDMLPRPTVEGMLEQQEIEIAPLAYMRGRTLRDAFVVLDEAQNTTRQQMKMFLTRLGENSKMVVTGDPKQVDLPKLSQSGLRHVLKVVKGVDGVGRTTFSASDVMRHPMVTKIINAYEEDEKRRREEKTS